MFNGASKLEELNYIHSLNSSSSLNYAIEKFKSRSTRCFWVPGGSSMTSVSVFSSPFPIETQTTSIELTAYVSVASGVATKKMLISALTTISSLPKWRSRLPEAKEIWHEKTPKSWCQKCIRVCFSFLLLLILPIYMNIKNCNTMDGNENKDQ